MPIPFAIVGTTSAQGSTPTVTTDANISALSTMILFEVPDGAQASALSTMILFEAI